MEDAELEAIKGDIARLKECAALSAHAIDQLKGVIEALVEKLFESKAGFVSVMNEKVEILAECSAKFVVDMSNLSKRLYELERQNSSMFQ